MSKKRLFGLTTSRSSPGHISVPRGTPMGQIMAEMVGMDKTVVPLVRYEDEESNKRGTEGEVREEDEEKFHVLRNLKQLAMN